MTDKTSQSEQFTGLILLTGVDKPGIAASLFECLSPFAVTVIDIEQVVINDRLILTVLIGANPAHQKAIEEDLESCATNCGVDIATLFSTGLVSTAVKEIFTINISAEKLHPRSVALITNQISKLGANIERFIRVSIKPVTISIVVSGCTRPVLEEGLSTLEFEDSTEVIIVAGL